MGVQIPGNACYTIVGMDKAVKNNTDNFHFIVCNRKLAIFQPIAIGCKAAVPFALTGFLFTASHRLSTDVFTFDFSNSRENGNHQFAGIFGTVNAILYANQVDTKILHELQGVQNIGGIASKTGELEYQNIRNAVFTVLHISQHLLKFVPSLNVLTGKSFVRIFSGNDHILVVGIFAQLFTLGIQTVTVHLHGRGYARINVTLGACFFHKDPSLSAICCCARISCWM